MNMNVPGGLAQIRLGFIPLLDAAIPIVAARCGFGEAHGLAIELVRETSWANVRDRLAIGHFDAAHLLAPLPVAAALGLAPIDVPIIAPMALGLGGNAITVSDKLWLLMKSAMPELQAGDPASMGAALRSVVQQRKQAGAPHLVFCVVHPFSSHNYELRYWLAASEIMPDSDVDIAIMPPSFMPDALRAGRIDGYCVGEPWNSLAAIKGFGRIILTKSAIWRASPEKVLGIRADWAEGNPVLVKALVNAMLDAALWCGNPSNHEELADLLAGPDFLAVPREVIHPALSGQILMADGHVHAMPEFLTFSDSVANFPWQSHALWFFTQMVRWGQVDMRPGLRERVIASFRPDLYRDVAKVRGMNVPISNMKVEATPLGTQVVQGTLAPLELPNGGFMDHKRFDPDAIDAYAGSASGQGSA